MKRAGAGAVIVVSSSAFCQRITDLALTHHLKLVNVRVRGWLSTLLVRFKQERR